MAAIEREMYRETEMFSCPYSAVVDEIENRAGDRQIVAVSHALWTEEDGTAMASIVLVTLRPREYPE